MGPSVTFATRPSQNQVSSKEYSLRRAWEIKRWIRQTQKYLILTTDSSVEMK